MVDRALKLPTPRWSSSREACRILGTSYVEFAHHTVMQAVSEVLGVNDELAHRNGHAVLRPGAGLGSAGSERQEEAKAQGSKGLPTRLCTTRAAHSEDQRGGVGRHGPVSVGHEPHSTRALVLVPRSSTTCDPPQRQSRVPRQEGHRSPRTPLGALGKGTPSV